MSFDKSIMKGYYLKKQLNGLYNLYRTEDKICIQSEISYIYGRAMIRTLELLDNQYRKVYFKPSRNAVLIDEELQNGLL